jgi:hypothetical protein
MKPPFLCSIALFGAWLLNPLLQVEHEPVVGTSSGATATTSATDDQSVQKPTTKKGSSTMR